MSRTLGLDVGEKTIGVAISDEESRLAFPGETILRQEGWRRDMAALRALVCAKGVRRIVVGMPVMMDGRPGAQAARVTEFIATLRNSIRIPVVVQDERLSTREAERLLAEAGRTGEESKRVVDSVAACLILQAFLDRSREGSANLRSGPSEQGEQDPSIS